MRCGIDTDDTLKREGDHRDVISARLRHVHLMQAGAIDEATNTF